LSSKTKNLVVLLGPTAVGKSATALRLAHKFDGEIINCDSMQVYRGFDIGTDKLPEKRREGIPHHLIDIVESHIQFTAAEFVKHALEAISSISVRSRLPIITGGTGLYLKSLLEGLFPETRKDPSARLRLEREVEQKGLEHLWERLMAVDPDYGCIIGKNDRVRIIRALEVYESTNRPITAHFRRTRSFVKDFNILKIGLKLEKEKLYRRIESRVDKMFEQGIIDEVKVLIDAGVDESSPPFRALGYKHVLSFLKGKVTLEEAVTLTKRDTRHYAKRQMTWFRKTKGVAWFSAQEAQAIEAYIKDRLN